MDTHPIRDDPGATDDWGSRGGHLRSNDIKIRVSPITRDMMEKETRKWCQTTWLAKPLRRICIWTYLLKLWQSQLTVWVCPIGHAQEGGQAQVRGQFLGLSPSAQPILAVVWLTQVAPKHARLKLMGHSIFFFYNLVRTF